MSNLPAISAVWIGEKLNALAYACLNSFIQKGHDVHLYTYGAIDNTPSGIKICDGNEIISSSNIIKHKKTNSYALFADIFRYQLLKKRAGTIYVDCDVYCLKPVILPKHNHLFGYESPYAINVAILALPPDSALLEKLIKISTTPSFVPEWYSPYNKLRLKIKRAFGYAKDITEMGWGIIGPSAMTYYVKKLNLTHLAQPTDILYPIHYEEIDKLLNPDIHIEQITCIDSICIHLYNEKLRLVDFNTLPGNCILAKMLKNAI